MIFDKRKGKKMNRLEMLQKARQLAYEQVDGCSALDDAEYAELKQLPEEKAIEQLAANFLKEAAEYNFGK